MRRTTIQDGLGLLPGIPRKRSDNLGNNIFGKPNEAACWAHVRRKFFDLHEAHKSPVAAEALQRIAVLYAIEDQIRGRLPEERLAVRRQRAKPLLEAMKGWL